MRRHQVLRVDTLLPRLRTETRTSKEQGQVMDIAEACRTIRQANDFFVAQGKATFDAVPLPRAVVVLKNYLENTRADGRCIQELLVADASLLTHAGIRWVMPFVLSAESLEASSKRARFDRH